MFDLVVLLSIKIKLCRSVVMRARIYSNSAV
jgi:hypothetical protein